MFGFLIGTLSLIGFIKVWKGGRRWQGGRRRWALRRLYQHLDTTPGQEKVIEGAVDEVERVTRRARGAFVTSGADFAQAFRGEHFDGAKLDERFTAQQTAIDEVKRAVREALQATHEALTPQQRARAADLMEFGPGALHGCGRSGRRFHPHHATA